jgi:Cu(I)-responsive transcriptional regulator
MNIGAAATASGVSAKLIRYYESIGLLPKALRRANSYRDYDERDVHELRFIGRARALGFSLAEIGMLLSLWRDRDRPSRDVHDIAHAHLKDVEARIAELQGVAATLRHLVCACHGDERPDCPILDELAEPKAPAPPSPP